MKNYSLPTIISFSPTAIVLLKWRVWPIKMLHTRQSFPKERLNSNLKSCMLDFFFDFSVATFKYISGIYCHPIGLR